MEKVVYRGLRASDLDTAVAFVNELVAEDTYLAVDRKYSRREEKKWLNSTLKAIKAQNEARVVAEVDGKMVGACHVARRADFNRARHSGTFGISVLKKWRGKGIGTELARRTIAKAKKIGIRLMLLSYFENNPFAPGFYRNMGFRECGKWPKAILFRGKYVDEIMMYKQL